MAKRVRSYSRRTMALFWCGVVALIIGSMIYFEQIPMLYAFATVALVVLLIVVGFSDLESVGRDSLEGFSADKE